MDEEPQGSADSAISNDILSKFIILILLVMLVQGFPVVHPFQGAIRARFVPLAYAFGLKQGEWALFCPEIKRNNAQIEVVGSDGILWTTPDWAQAGVFEKWRNYRQGPYETVLPFLSDSLAHDGLSKFAFELGGTETRPAIVWNWTASDPPDAEEHAELPHCRQWEATNYEERTLLFR